MLDPKAEPSHVFNSTRIMATSTPLRELFPHDFLRPSPSAVFAVGPAVDDLQLTYINNYSYTNIFQIPPFICRIHKPLFYFWIVSWSWGPNHLGFRYSDISNTNKTVITIDQNWILNLVRIVSKWHILLGVILCMIIARSELSLKIDLIAFTYSLEHPNSTRQLSRWSNIFSYYSRSNPFFHNCWL